VNTVTASFNTIMGQMTEMSQPTDRCWRGCKHISSY